MWWRTGVAKEDFYSTWSQELRLTLSTLSHGQGHPQSAEFHFPFKDSLILVAGISTSTLEVVTRTKASAVYKLSI